jgi:hypothetical protein
VLVVVYKKVGSGNMILKNKVLVAIAFCCSVGTSMAMNPIWARRIVSLKTAERFAQACLPKSITPEAGIKEWKECENQVEEIGGISCVCPQIFLCNFLNREFVIKAVQERAMSEISSAKSLCEHLSTKRRSNTVDIVSFTFYAIFREGQLLKTKHVKDYSEDEIHPNDWVLEFMPRAPGISLEKLMDDPASFGKCTDNMFQKIGEAIHYLNFELDIMHMDLHTGNIIVDPDTMKISFIDFDRFGLFLPCCYDHYVLLVENLEAIPSDSVLLFFSVFYTKFLFPIMTGSFHPTDDNEKILHFMHLLLSSSLGESRRIYFDGCLNIHKWMRYSMETFAKHDATGADITAQANTPGGILDQKIDTICKYLKRFIVFFEKDTFPCIGREENPYAQKAISLFFSLLTNSTINNLEAIRNEEKRLGIPELEWHTSLLPVSE